MPVTNEQLKIALDQAKQNPNSQMASELQRRLETGRFDDQLKEIGVVRTRRGLQPFQPLGERVSSAVEERGGTIGRAVRGEGEFEGRSTLGRGFGAASQATQAVGDVTYEALPRGLRRLVDNIGQKIGKGFDFVVDKLSNTKLFQEAAMSGETEKLEEILQVVSDAGIVSGGIAGAAETAGLASRTVSTAGRAGGRLAASTRRVISDANVANRTTQAIRQAFDRTPADTLVKQQQQLVDILDSKVIENRKGVNRRLDRLAARTGSSRQDLLRELVEEGGLPEVKGDAIDFTDFMASADKEFQDISQAINRRVAQMPNSIDLGTYQQQVLNRIRSARAVGAKLDQMESQVDRIFASYRNKYGNSLNAENINEIRVEANKVFKEQTQPEIDSMRAVGDVARDYLNEFDPEISDALAQQSRLARVRRTAGALNREKIAINEYLQSLGGFTGTVLAGAGGITAIAGGPAGLLIAGMAAKFGSKALANFVRNRQFSPRTFNLIKQSLNENPQILDDLLEKASKEDRALLESRLLPAAGESSFQEPAIEIGPRDGFNVRGLGDEPPASRVLDDMSFNQGATTTTKNLLEEAKKYKSADEFARSEGKIIYHSSEDTFANGKPNFDAYFGTEDWKSNFAKEFGNKEYEVVLPDGYEILDLTKNTPQAKKFIESFGGTDDFYGDVWVDKYEILPELKKRGYVGAKFEDEYILTKEAIESLQTKKELEDIWKQANR